MVVLLSAEMRTDKLGICGRWFGFLVVGGADLETKEPSVSTMLTSFENSFDKYGALSTPLYQTATFKQVIGSLGLQTNATHFLPKWGTKSFELLPVQILGEKTLLLYVEEELYGLGH